MQYLVSRHAGAIEWCQEQGYQADKVLTHLDVSLIQANDVVIGTLPIPLAAQVQAKGARYLHLNLPLTAELRGVEISAKQMTELGASLQEFRIEVITQR